MKNNISKDIFNKLDEGYFDGDQITVDEDEFTEDDFVGNVKSDLGIYFGDPCYVLSDELYNVWIDEYNCVDGSIDTGKGIFVVHGTKYGDGEYYGYNYPNNYSFPVDSGTLAIIPIEMIDPKKKDRSNELGHIFSESREGMLSYRDGVFKIDFDNKDSILVDTNM